MEVAVTYLHFERFVTKGRNSVCFNGEKIESHVQASMRFPRGNFYLNVKT